MRAPGYSSSHTQRHGFEAVVSCNALCAGKSDCVENRFQSFAEIVATNASWKTRQMSALRSRVEISDDRWPHFMALRALPEANLISTWLQPGIVAAVLTALQE
jgi:hypothetical protein